MNPNRAADRRLEGRARTSFKAVVTLIDFRGEPFAEGLGDVSDLSRTGVGLRGVRLIRGRVPPSVEFVVIKAASPSLQDMWLRARAVHLRYESKGAAIGATIASTSPALSELLDFIPVPGPAQEETS